MPSFRFTKSLSNKFTMTTSNNQHHQPTTLIYPKISLSLAGQDGNAFAILGRAKQLMREHGICESEIKQFQCEATADDYDHLLRTCMRWFDCH